MGDLMRRWAAAVGAQPHRVTASDPGSILIAEPKIETLKVTFTPVQSGSGTPSPSNARPIIGHGSIAVGIGADTFTASLGGTYYGGTVDLVSGVMTVTHGCYAFTGDESGWRMYNNSPPDSACRASISVASLPVAFVQNKLHLTGASSHFALRTGVYGSYGEAVAGAYFQPNDPNGTHWGGNLDTFKAWLVTQKNAGNPVQLYGPITPQTVTLTPQSIAALRGMQTVASGAGSVEITYYTV